MFSFLRRKVSPASPTFNERVTGFWRWFTAEAPRLYAIIEAGRCADLAPETSAKVDECFPGCAWVYGPGANGVGHSFTLSGEGVIHRQLLTQHWLALAPTLPGWTFHASRQAGPVAGHVIEISGMRFDPQEIWVTPTVNAENENIDLTIWHPLWEKITPQQRLTVTFLFLDEALGEYGTEWWIGRIEHGKDKLAGSFPLVELPGYVAETDQARGWKKLPPGESWILFEVKKSPGNFPRADVITQSTGASRLFTEYMESAGELVDPLAGCGADYVYVSLERSFFPPGEEVGKRGQLEDVIGGELEKSRSGLCIGGALGTERCYVDFLIFDGARSLEIIRQALRTLKTPSGTMIEYFAREKRGQRIAL